MSDISDFNSEDTFGEIPYTDPDWDNIEDPELVAMYDPSIFDEVDEMVEDYDDDIFSGGRDTHGNYWLQESVSLDLTDHIDWDSIDYE